MADSLRDETVVVTGGASGNGRAIARACAAEGADVVVVDRRDSPRDGGKPTHELIAEETDVTVRFERCDVTDLDRLEAVIEATDDLGGVSVLVNNAGILDPGPLRDVTPSDYDETMGVNVRAPFFATQFAANTMVEAGGGAVVNISSVAGLRGMAGGALYCASKGAIRLLTYALAAELGPHGIRVNAVHPGYVETPMFERDVPGHGGESEQLAGDIPLGRIGTPGEVAEAVVYLASDRAGYVNGASLTVDGGLATSQ